MTITYLKNRNNNRITKSKISMNKRIFVTTILPEHLIAKHKLSFAACNFSFNLMSGGGFDKVYSVLPLYTGGEMDKEAFEDTRFELVYDTLRRKGGIWQKLAALKEQCAIFKRTPKGASVWYYNLSTLNALLFVLLKIFKPSVQQTVIVLDFTPVESGFGLSRVYLKFINSAHGRICLANSPLFKRENSVTLPGVVPNNDEVLPLISTPTKSFLLSGAINETIAQTSMVLEAFAQLPDFELHVTGTGDTKLVEEYAEKYPNIHWHGQLPFNKYLELMHSITFQLSTRDPNMPENQCNFPSKIIESLLHNRIIISTIEYKQLDGIKYFRSSSEPQFFKQHIEGIMSLSNSSLMEYANQGKKVAVMFCTDVWNETMKRIEENQ